jgi:hypothetical protein
MSALSTFFAFFATFLFYSPFLSFLLQGRGHFVAAAASAAAYPGDGGSSSRGCLPLTICARQ